MSDKEEKTKEEFPYWYSLDEQAMWDEYLAWCREQENSAHE